MWNVFRFDSRYDIMIHGRVCVCGTMHMRQPKIIIHFKYKIIMYNGQTPYKILLINLCFVNTCTILKNRYCGRHWTTPKCGAKRTGRTASIFAERFRIDSGHWARQLCQSANGRIEAYTSHLCNESYQKGIGHGWRGHRLGTNGEACVRNGIQSSIFGGTAFVLPNRIASILCHRICSRRRFDVSHAASASASRGACPFLCGWNQFGIEFLTRKGMIALISHVLCQIASDHPILFLEQYFDFMCVCLLSGHYLSWFEIGQRAAGSWRPH